MKNRLKLVLFTCLFCLSWFVHAAAPYDARIGEREILTPKPAPAPRLNGPKLYGARPGKNFIYRIPCQGERPLRFEVQGLPEGLTLDVDGILTGTVPPRKGSYTMTIKARNARGADSRRFDLVVGDKLALTPPTGWNSWGGYMLYVSDEVIRKAADVMVNQGLADVGFQYVSMDDCWMRISPENYAARTEAKKKQHAGFDYEGLIGDVRDKAGNILPNLHFPDMKALADYIHAYGLKIGLYSSPGPYTCQNFAGSLGHEEQDAAQYARWGFDLLKYDQCSASEVLKELKLTRPNFKTADFWKPMADSLRGQDRDIFFNLCQYGQDNPWQWAPGLGIQSWRTGGDLNHNVGSYFTQALRVATELRDYGRPGQWNDPDYMYIQRIRDHRQMAKPTIEIPLDTNQRYQYVTLWSIICAPFFFSCDIEKIDEFTIRLLANADVININQDELGEVARVKRNQDNDVMMVKKLADGSQVVAVFNRRAKEEADIKVDWAELGERGTRNVYDVWRQRNVGALTDGFTVRLSPNGVGLFVVRK